MLLHFSILKSRGILLLIGGFECCWPESRQSYSSGWLHLFLLVT
jgi:hypothetical protein